MEALQLAVRAATITDGAVDPTLGQNLIELGYDRDWGDLAQVSSDRPLETAVRMRATRRGAPWRVDRAARRPADGPPAGRGAARPGSDGQGAGRRPRGAGGSSRLRLGRPALAGRRHRHLRTASTARLADPRHRRSSRRRRRRGPDDHDRIGWTGHIQSGAAGAGITTEPPSTTSSTRTTVSRSRPSWRTASVAAATCADANIASTAALVMGTRAPAWLAGQDLPARLVAVDGAVTVQGGWPA